jgi:hypothetical protein
LYGLPFLTLNKSYQRQFLQILTTPLRKTLGLPKYVSASRLLWEFGIPDILTLQLQSLIQLTHRSQRILNKNPSSIAASLAYDINNPLPTVSPTFCLPLPTRFLSLADKHNLPLQPLSKKPFQQLIQRIAASTFLSSSSSNAINLKPSITPAPYLYHDTKPTVGIRAKLRLGVALSFSKLFLFKKRESSACDFCSTTDGSSIHLFMHCPHLAYLRSICETDLLQLHPPIPLTYDLILGNPPSLAKNKAYGRKFLDDLHKRCLGITAKFILAVSKIHYL